MNDGIKALRWRQMKNFHLALMVSLGHAHGADGGRVRTQAPATATTTPTGTITTSGNFDWRALEAKREAYFRFHSGLIKFVARTRSSGAPSFSRTRTSPGTRTTGITPSRDFSPSPCTIEDKAEETCTSASNAHEFYVDAALPPPPGGKSWHRVVDTNLPSPADFTPEGEPGCGATTSRERFGDARSQMMVCDG